MRKHAAETGTMLDVTDPEIDRLPGAGKAPSSSLGEDLIACPACGECQEAPGGPQESGLDCECCGAWIELGEADRPSELQGWVIAVAVAFAIPLGLLAIGVLYIGWRTLVQ